MPNALNISESAGLALHAVNVILRRDGQTPIKLTDLATTLNASVTRLGRVMRRLALAEVVTSKRGPTGGFILGRRAGTMTHRDVRKLFDESARCEPCVMGHHHCPFGECLLRSCTDTVNVAAHQELDQKKILEL